MRTTKVSPDRKSSRCGRYMNSVGSSPRLRYFPVSTTSFWGIRDDAGRLQVVANFNNDIGEYWEWSEHGYYPIELSNEGYKLGVNYIIYALTH